MPRCARQTALSMLMLVVVARTAQAQVDTQLWGNITLDRVKSERLVYELDFEPKVLVSKPPDAPGCSRNTVDEEFSTSDIIDFRVKRVF